MNGSPPHKRWIACFFALLLAITIAPIPTANAAQNGMVRVMLSSMGAVSNVAIKLDGVYGIPSRPDITLQSGKSVVVSISGGRLSLNTGSQTIDMGSSFTIKEYENTQGKNLMTLLNTKYGTISYLGDMQFSAAGGSINMISYLYLEDYLLGVVPYEMSNTFPVEALKAQAVAARSYAARMMTGTGTYDIGDTTAAQVYKGYSSRDNIAHQAVKGTEGIVIMSGGSIATTFYSASNGGQTEMPSNRLNITAIHNVGCYAMVDDPYDLRNPMSSCTPINFTSSGTFSNVGLEQVIKNAAGARLGGSAGLSITSIINPRLTNVRQLDPKSVGISRFYKTLEMTVGTNRGTADIALDLETTVADACAPDMELFTLDVSGGNYTLYGRRYGHGVGLSQRGAEQMAKEGQSYATILGFYYPGGQQVKLDLTRDPITQRSSSGSSGAVSGAPVGVGLVTLSSSSSTLTMRKTASSSGSKVTTIPHGSTVEVYSIDGDWVHVAYGGNSGYVSSKYVVVTMTPTAAPVSSTPSPSEPIIAYGNITLQDDSSIRIRSGPNTAGTEVLGYVPKNELVGIVGMSGEWYRIDYLGLVGYVMAQYVTINPNYTPPPVVSTPPPVVAPTPTPAAAPIGTATAKVASAIYSGEGRYYTKLADIPKGTTVEVWKSDPYWYQVRYNGASGYMSAEDLTTGSSDSSTGSSKSSGSSATSTPKKSSSSSSNSSSSSSSATIKTSTKGASVTIRSKASSSSDRVGSVKDGTKVTVLEKGSSYSKIKVGGVEGYVSSSYLK